MDDAYIQTILSPMPYTLFVTIYAHFQKMQSSCDIKTYFTTVKLALPSCGNENNILIPLFTYCF
jgi:hypothetical protein